MRLSDFIPSGFLNYYRARRSGLRCGYPFKGRYNSFGEVSQYGGYNNRVKIEERFFFGLSTSHQLLALLVSIYHKDKVKILDFGGGLGVAYQHLKISALNKGLDYHIVELETMCEKGRELYGKEITYHTELPDTNFDIAYLSSSLQYIEKWRGLLLNITRLNPQYILITVPMSDNDTYVTAQINLRGSVLPVWLFKPEDIISKMTDCGYRFIYQSGLDKEYKTSIMLFDRRLNEN